MGYSNYYFCRRDDDKSEERTCYGNYCPFILLVPCNMHTGVLFVVLWWHCRACKFYILRKKSGNCLKVNPLNPLSGGNFWIICHEALLDAMKLHHTHPLLLISSLPMTGWMAKEPHDGFVSWKVVHKCQFREDKGFCTQRLSRSLEHVPAWSEQMNDGEPSSYRTFF